jgi:hypothetical protein
MHSAVIIDAVRSPMGKGKPAKADRPGGALSSVRFGLQTMCEAGGMANATLIERV